MNIKQFFTDPFGFKRIAELELMLGFWQRANESNARCCAELQVEVARLDELLQARVERMTELCDENVEMARALGRIK